MKLSQVHVAILIALEYFEFLFCFLYQTRVVDCFTKNILKYVEDGMEDHSDIMT